MAAEPLILDTNRQRLLDDYQHCLPLVLRPFADIGNELGISEDKVLEELTALSEDGVISRVGPVFAPNRLGCSTLAALAVVSGDLERIAELVSAYDEVNHNYQRDHYYNLWFVVTAADRKCIDDVLDDIARQTGLEVLDLPMIEDYHIDLGFRLW